MQKSYLATLIVVSLLICSNSIQGQPVQRSLNHAELFKQYTGVWKGEMGKDTTFFMEIKSFYNGFETYLKTETKGKMVLEEKTIMGYDKKSDKLIETGIVNNSPEVILWALWFTSKNKCEEILFEDISNPDKAILKWTFELPSPDLFIWTSFKDNKITGTYSFHRSK